ncbi:MAG: beta-ketoacyl-[acyl-carrier-protein] synthase family protein [Deltaproteobacteria bacterium]|nr:beta-ketoacyl-[acyl-carrier-protein] synthase family protein [Deltaproteobacteria bacterium]
MSDLSRQVVVTGVAACCHMGDDLEAIQKDLREGRATPLKIWQPAVDFRTRCKLVGLFENPLEPDDLGISKKDARFMGRAARMAIYCAKKALSQAQVDSRDIAVVVGSGTGDVETHRYIHSVLEKTRNGTRISPTVIPRLMASTVSANLANFFESTGPSFTAAAACAGGAYSILLASELIANGHCEKAIAGGVEVADIHFHTGFDSMRGYNVEDNDRPERALRPYAADRAGFLFSEGGGILILETQEAASRRGAKILGKIRGYGMSSDGQHDMVAPSPEGARLSMERALRHARVKREEVDYINTHGTSTRLGDISEVRGIRDLFGDLHVAYSSTKGYTGHTVSAAGPIEAIFTFTMLREGWIAPSVNAEPLDPDIKDYPPVVVPTVKPMKIALSNSFGFGGTNVTLVLEKP